VAKKHVLKKWSVEGGLARVQSCVAANSRRSLRGEFRRNFTLGATLRIPANGNQSSLGITREDSKRSP
jgi:hypothetical protein